MNTPFPRFDEAARMVVFNKEIAETFRQGVFDAAEMHRNVGGHLTYYAEKIRENYLMRNKPLELRSLGWLPHGPEKVAQVAAIWDEVDKRDNLSDRARARVACCKAISEWRWAKWILATLDRPEIADEIKEGPRCEYLHWAKPSYRPGLHEMDFKEPTILDSKGRIIAEIVRRPSDDRRTPTMRAHIYTPYMGRLGPPLTWSLFRQRKGAVAWMVRELHKRSGAMFGKDIDLPEWK